MSKTGTKAVIAKVMKMVTADTMHTTSTTRLVLRDQRRDPQIRMAAMMLPSGRVQNQWMREMIRMFGGRGSISKTRYISTKTGAAFPIRKSDRTQRRPAMHGRTIGLFLAVSVSFIFICQNFGRVHSTAAVISPLLCNRPHRDFPRHRESVRLSC